MQRRTPSRYRHLYKSVFDSRAKSIMEIGVYNAYNSNLMIETAGIFHPKNEIEYFGFDLFEDIDDEEIRKEHSKKPNTEAQIREKLGVTRANVQLYRGYTQDTLPVFVEQCRRVGKTMDFIFIDGGHLLETISSDWENVEKLMNDATIVIFDDYYTNPSPSLGEVGCQKLIDALDREKYDVEVLDPRNSFEKDWGTLHINFVRVRRRKL